MHTTYRNGYFMGFFFINNISSLTLKFQMGFDIVPRGKFVPNGVIEKVYFAKARIKSFVP